MLGKVVVLEVVHSAHSGHKDTKLPRWFINKVQEFAQLLRAEHKVFSGASEALAQDLAYLLELFLFLFGTYVGCKVLIGKFKPLEKRRHILFARSCGRIRSERKADKVEF